jgi:SHS2 domain-containing protein
MRDNGKNIPGTGWEHFSHQADIGIRGSGATLAEAFEQAAYALTAVITDPESVRTTQAIEIRCEASDPELLLVDWLNALIYEMAVRRMLFSEFRVRINDHRLQATAKGEAIDIRRHQPAVEVKGATLTELKVALNGNGHWSAQCVVDV